jgi:ABC-2 type transport system permease protein
MIAVLATMLPTFILSGFVFPIRNMPWIIQVVTYFIPARYFLVALRAIVLKGVGISAFWEELLFMTAFAVIVLTVSSVRLKKIIS